MNSSSADESIASSLHPLAKEILKQRDLDDMSSWLQPDFSQVIHDPMLFADMKDFLDRMHQAIEAEEQVVVFSDFDTDGIPAAAMWHDFFAEIGYENFRIYIPQRDVEGFGLKVPQVNEFAADGVDFLITVDCGIRSHTAIEKAKKEGMDVAILDHHVAAKENPPADFIINPALENEPYPFSSLCGAGVVFKALQALGSDDRFGLPNNFAKGQLGMVAIATISDMVPLVGENRALAQFGLQILRSTNRPGLRELYEKGRIQGRELTEVDVGFTIGSHINAASRLDKPRVAFDLLTTRNHQDGKQLAKELHSLYRKRKRRTTTLKEAVRKAVADHSNGDAIVIGSEDWKPALLGPVAHSLTDNYGVPVFLWGKANGRRKGSARAGRHNVVEMLQSIDPDFLQAYGGHEMAGGFELNDVKAADFREALAAVAAENEIADTDSTHDPVAATLEQISWRLYESLEKLGPFGVGNKAPLFRITGVHVDDVRLFGAGDEHIAVTVTDGGNEQEAVCFFATKQMKEVQPGQKVALVGAVEKTTFGFRKKLQFRMEEITVLDA